jgi:signal transduction histidine kinase
LLQRLLQVVTPVAATLIVVTVASTRGPMQTAAVALGLLFWPPVLLASLRRSWPFAWRGGVLLALFVASVWMTYWYVGFHGNGAVLATGAVVLAGLLFGKRTALTMTGGLLLAPIVAGSYALLGPASAVGRPDLALSSPPAWFRTTVVASGIWLVLALGVTFVVGRLEGAHQRTKAALRELELEIERREQAERAREEAQAAAAQAQKMELVAHLAAGVAHDFNNLLGVLGGWAELALSIKPEEEEEMHAAVESALVQGRSLTRQLAALSRQDAQIVRRVQLDQIAQTAVKTLRRVLPAKVKLELASAEPVAIDADETELQQVLLNLVINARDALPSGGAIRVSALVEESIGELAVVGGSLAPGRWAVLVVEDNGTGIEPHVRDKIFELFFTTKPAGRGTGLGLATVLRIARAAGGGIGLSSEVGKGTAFRIYLPASSA